MKPNWPDSAFELPGTRSLLAEWLPNAWGSPDWMLPVGLALAFALGLVIWSYFRSDNAVWLRVVSALLKTGGLILLAIILLEPKVKKSTPKPGANLFVMMVDKSQSLAIKDASSAETREQQLVSMLDPESVWLNRLNEDFDLRRYTFDSRLHPVNDFASYVADATGSNLINSLKMIGRRVEGRNTGGVLLFTDGNATDLNDLSIDWTSLPPIYPVVLGTDNIGRDIGLLRVNVSQTNFESAPVTITCEVETRGFEGRSVSVELLDNQKKRLQVKTVSNVEDAKKFAVRFEVKPEARGVHFYQVRAFEKNRVDQFDRPETSREATLDNNVSLVSVDRGRGPFRILYVSGRPNWEYKFLKRALDADPEIHLTGLIRLARKEPKFSFRGHKGESTNSLFRGFGNKEDQTAEQYDEPVLIRMGVKDGEELRAGFPKDEIDLFKFDALILDDIESEFFTQDQKSLIQQFVSVRGGSLLMLGGQESFVRGGYDRTPIGELLPVYLDRFTSAEPAENFWLSLTREGWLQPWVRVRSTEDAEKTRITEMPPFKTINRVRSIKPGATVLARVQDRDGTSHPALVVQKFGKGSASALLIGDLWRWHLQDSKNDDMMKSWRQTTRWLVGDVPRRIEVELKQVHDANHSVRVQVRVHDDAYKPLDNATIKLKIKSPKITKDGKPSAIELTAEPSDQEAGLYEAVVVSNEAGNYVAEILVAGPDGSDIGTRNTGWISQSSKEEFRNLEPNREFLELIASKTNGRILKPKQLDRFTRSIPNAENMITETKITPWWHHWSLLALMILMFVGEWGLRRWKGMP